MAQADQVVSSLLVTDTALSAHFPSGFHKRCMYAAFAIDSLLEDAGLDAQVAGGGLLCAAVSTDGRQLSLQPFGRTGVGEPSHHWVHANGMLIDPGPAYLLYELPYPAAHFSPSNLAKPPSYSDFDSCG